MGWLGAFWSLSASYNCDDDNYAVLEHSRSLHSTFSRLLNAWQHSSLLAVAN